MKISIKDNGDAKRLQSKFRKLAQGIKQRRAMMNRIGVQLLNAVSQNFKEQGHEGAAWEPLKPRTLARRRTGRGVKKSRGRILEDTGQLRRSFAAEADNDSVRVGSNVIYAPTHEFGRGAIPKRPMLPGMRKGLQLALMITENYIAESINKADLGGAK